MTSFIKRGRRYPALALVVMLLAMLALTACGDNTATPASSATTAAATTAAATTAAATTAATTAAATTAAATTAAATTAAATTAAAGATTAAVSGTTGGTLVVGTVFTSKGFDPAREYTQTAFTVFHSVYQTLVTNKGGDVTKVVPDLADSWTISPDGKSYTFKLKSGLKFVSGNPVTADDVVFSYNRLKNVKGQSAFVTDNMDKFEAKDPSTVVITLKNVSPDTLSLLTTPSFAVLDSKTAKSNGATDAADADKSDKADTFLNNQSIGSGPYVLKSFKPETEVDLEKNPNYSSTVSYDKIIIKNQPDVNIQKASLEKGDVDFAFDLGPEQAAGLNGKSGVTIKQATSLTIFFLLMNADPTVSQPTSKPEVRQAIKYAINYKDYLDLGGPGSVQPPSIIPIGLAGALTKSDALPTDLAKAKDLMAKAGYANGFTIKMSYPSDLTQNGVKFETMAQKMQADLAQINITAELDPKTIQVWLDEYRAGKQPMTLSLWSPDYNDPSDYLTFTPGQKLGLRAGWKAGADAAIEDLAKKAAVELDETKRLDEYQQMQKLMNQSGPFAPFMQPTQVLGYRSNLNGVEFNPVWVVAFNETTKK
ncbi:MAG TPA: ABC transporter substrate-binding protein [Chloroflexia bacterium]|nr:ABC transporter substrate-binding protein [Chloroflexia bacterium]